MSTGNLRDRIYHSTSHQQSHRVDYGARHKARKPIYALTGCLFTTWRGGNGSKVTTHTFGWDKRWRGESAAYVALRGKWTIPKRFHDDVLSSIRYDVFVLCLASLPLFDVKLNDAHFLAVVTATEK